MALDTFDGAADTALTTHDSNWNDGIGATAANLELNGSGSLRGNNTFLEGQAYYTGATNDVTITLPTGYVSSGTQPAGPSIHVTAGQEGYTAHAITSSTTITQVRLFRNGTNVKTFSSGTGDAPATVTSTAGVNLTIRLRTSGNNVIVTLGDGTNTEDFTYDDSSAGVLTGGNGGLFLYQNGTAAIVVQEWQDSAGGGDVTAPVLSSSSYTDDTRTVDLAVTTDTGEGTLYWVITDAATQPSAAQVEAGLDDGGGAPLDSGSQAVSSSGAQSILAAGPFDFGSNAWAHIMHKDVAGNQSTVETIALGDGATASGSGDFAVAYETTVSAVVSQTEIALTAGPDADSQMVGNVLLISESGVDSNFCKFQVTAYDATGGANEHTCTGTKDAAGYTISVGDRVRVLPAYASVTATLADASITSAALDSTGVTTIQSGLALGSNLDQANSKLDLLNSDGTGGVKLSNSGVAGIYVGTVGASPTTTTMVLSGGVAFDGQHKGSIFKLLDGPVAGLLCKITASVAATDTVTFEVFDGGGALPSAPVQGNVYKIG